MRRVPPAIVLALALWLGFALVRLVVLLTADVYYHAFPPWSLALGAGFRFTAPALLLAGMLELRQRPAAIGVVAMIVLECVWLVLPFDVWREPMHRELMAYATLAAQLVVMGSLAASVWMRRPGLAVCAIASAILVAPPPPLATLVFGLAGSNYIGGELLELALQLPVYVVLLLLSIELARDSESRPIVVTSGLRHSARALCVYSAVAALAGIRVLDQRLMLTALAAAALGWCAFGLLRAARTPLTRWFTTASAAAVLWCTSLELSSLQRIYAHTEGRDMTVEISLLCVAAAAFMTIALANIVDKIQLQAKGVGAVMMFVTALAIALFLVPQSQSERSLIALDVLTGFVTALGAWMLSWLCRLGAEKLERTDELPVARVV